MQIPLVDAQLNTESKIATNRYWDYLKKALTKGLLILFGILLALLIVEASLRIVAPIPYSMQVEYIPDGHLGFRLAPNKTYVLKSGGKASVNNWGLRSNEDVEIAKSSDVFRIVVLGGSAAFAYEVDDAKTWTSLLETKLKNTYNYQFEVINAGVPGYSIFDSKINYLYRLRPLSPDAVIVYHTWNDMKYFKALEAGATLNKNAYTSPNRFRSFVRHFQIAWHIRNFYHQYILPRQRENTYADPLASDIGHISENGLAHRWERKNFEDLALLLESDQVLPIFVTQGSLLSAENVDDPQVRAKVYAEYQGLTYRQIVEQWQAVSEIIRNVAHEQGTVFIDAYALMPHDLNHFEDHVHLTEMGNQKLADIIFNTLQNDIQFNNFFAESTSSRILD